MEEKFISLLYPTEESRLFHQNRDNLPRISDDVCYELGLEEIFDLKSASLTDFFTTSEDVIRYRQEVFADIFAVPEVKETLAKVHPILDDITELRRLDRENTSSGDSYLYSITEIELYVSCIDTLRDGFAPVRDRLRSRAFSALADLAIELGSSEYYKELNKKLEALASRVHEVRSITVGVNLDRELRPVSAGVISINSEQFKSGKVLDKILRFSFKKVIQICSIPTKTAKQYSDSEKESTILYFPPTIGQVL